MKCEFKLRICGNCNHCDLIRCIDGTPFHKTDSGIEGKKYGETYHYHRKFYCDNWDNLMPVKAIATNPKWCKDFKRRSWYPEELKQALNSIPPSKEVKL